MNDEQLLRYSRQIMLPEIDAEGQTKLANASVLIIGVGGLGSSASIYLSSSGVGKLTLVDFDSVDLSNLQRQIVHSTSDIGRLKVDSAREHLQAINPDTEIITINKQLETDELNEHVGQSDIVLDCSDNFQTRFAINKACVENKIPLVSAAAIRFEAQISVFDPRLETSPCYRCLYNEESNVEQTCTANGVIAPLLGIIGSMQALETMKLITGVGETLTGRLLLFDAMSMEWHSAKLNKDSDCPVCGTGNSE